MRFGILDHDVPTYVLNNWTEFTLNYVYGWMLNWRKYCKMLGSFGLIDQDIWKESPEPQISLTPSSGVK